MFDVVKRAISEGDLAYDSYVERKGFYNAKRIKEKNTRSRLIKDAIDYGFLTRKEEDLS